MVKILIIVALLSASFLSTAETLTNNDIHYVPKDTQWTVMNITPAKCDVCTPDIYIRSGKVKINNVWIYGNLNFSLHNVNELVIGSDTTFYLGDSMPTISIKEK